MDEGSLDDVKRIHESIQKIKNESLGYINKICELNNSIPEEGVATNYMVKCEDSLSGGCR